MVSAMEQPAACTPIFAAGDTVMHTSEGVCTVSEVRAMRFGSAPQQLYYVLKPSTVKSSSTVYMPVARGNSMLRKLLSPADIDGLISESLRLEPLWVENNKARKDAFLRVLQSGNYAQVIRMISEIHAHSEERIAQGRKPCASDENILSEAERLIHQEFSCVLHLSQKDTVDYICSRLKAS